MNKFASGHRALEIALNRDSGRLAQEQKKSVRLAEENDHQSAVSFLSSDRQAEILAKSAQVVHPLSKLRTDAVVWPVPCAFKFGVLPQLVGTRGSAKPHP